MGVPILGAHWSAAGLTGDLLYAILIILVVCSLPCVRRKGFFEIFYWTHNLFFPWFILLILHATHFWIWFILPAVLYILERILRSKLIKLARYGRTYIQKGFLLPSRVCWTSTMQLILGACMLSVAHVSLATSLREI